MADRFLHLTTPLGDNTLQLMKFSGKESISELFRFELEMIAENATEIHFDQILGQSVQFGVNGPEGAEHREFNGIVAAFAELHRDEDYTHYQAVVVPKLWILTQRVQSRIFQQKSVKDILEAVFTGLEVDFQVMETYEPREYVTQYHESDFAFASRLMEEEGIYYFFKHHSGHSMVVADKPQSHIDLLGPDTTLIYDKVKGGLRDTERIFGWVKQQEMRSGKYMLYDHKHQLAHRNLKAEKVVSSSLQVGAKTHKLKLAGNDTWEIYEYPGEYAKRFDGISKGGGEQTSELNKIFRDNERTVKLRMEATELPMILLRGASTNRFMMPGYKFSLERHFDGDGKYTITSVHHQGREGDVRARTSRDRDPYYENSFAAIPYDASFPFRPARDTPRPVIAGAQTAVVVGPSGEEIFTDKYGRVKVQFHWDREGDRDADSSCWIRVGTPWAGKQWGIIHIPRIGHEVIVDFLEGDPDRPIIVGSVYNSDTMPPYKLPDDKTQSGIISRSSKGGGPDNYNQIRFEDKKGSEEILIHAEKDQSIEVEHDETHFVGNDQTITVKHDRTETVDNDEKVQIKQNRHLKVGMDFNEDVGKNSSLKVGMNYQIKSGMNMALDSGVNVHLKTGVSFVIEAGVSLTLKAGASFISISPAGIAISGAPLVLINSGGAAMSGSGSNPTAPQVGEALTDKAKGRAKNAAAQIDSSAKAATLVMSQVAQQAMSGVSHAAAGALGSMQQMGQMAQGVAGQVMGEINGAVNQAQGLVNQAVHQAEAGLNSAVNQLSNAANELAGKIEEKAGELEQAAQQAANNVQQQVAQLENEAAKMAQQAQQQLQGAVNQVQGAAQQAMNQAQQAAQQAAQQIQAVANQAQQAVQGAEQQVAQMAQQAQQAAQNAANQAQQAVQQAKQQVEQMLQQGQAAAAQVVAQAQQAAQEAQQQLQNAADAAKVAAEEAKAAVEQEVNQVETEVSQAAAQAQEEVKQAEQQVQQAAQQVQQQAQQSAAQVQQAANQAQQQVSQAANQATQAAQNAGQMTQQAAQQVTQQVQQSAQQAEAAVAQTAQQAMGQVQQQTAQAAKDVGNAIKGLGI